jgi:phosphate transport system protein
MGRLTCEQLKTAVDAIETSDRAVAKRVIEHEPQADRMEHEIDRLAMRLLALRQPVAIDLRQALSAQRIANELERICDYAEDLAERCLGLHAGGGEPMAALVGLGRFAVALVEDAMAAYANGDTRLAQEVWAGPRQNVLELLWQASRIHDRGLATHLHGHPNADDGACAGARRRSRNEHR